MPTLYFICGLPCSGKTTYAKRLEREVCALRLTPDEWHTQLFGHDVLEDEHHTRHDLIESLLLTVAERVLALDRDVILDFGFWIKREREDLRAWAVERGVRTEFHFLEVSQEALFERLAGRNAALPGGASRIPKSLMKAWLPLFEPPDLSELETYDAHLYLCPLLR